MKEGCKKTLARGEWFARCGDTDMGQTLPALCTECGGNFQLRVYPPAKFALGDTIGSNGHSFKIEDTEATHVMMGDAPGYLVRHVKEGTDAFVPREVADRDWQLIEKHNPT